MAPNQILFYHEITFHLLCNIYALGIRVYNATWVNILYSCQICGLASMFQYKKYRNIWGGPRWLHRNSSEINVERTGQWLLFTFHSTVTVSADKETVKMHKYYTDTASSTSKIQPIPTNLQYECPSQICKWIVTIYFNFDKNLWVLQHLQSDRSDRNAAIFETDIITVSHPGGSHILALI